MRGRRQEKAPSSNVTFALTDATNAKLSMLVHDPVTGKAKYGMKSKLAEELFLRFFNATVAGKDAINIRDLRVEIAE